MKKGTYVRLIAMTAAPDTIPSSNGKPDWNAKKRPTVKPGQWLEGYLADDIALAKPIRFTRHIRNGKVRSAFRTSPVCVVQGNDVITEMSIFRVLRVPPFDPEKSLEAWD